MKMPILTTVIIFVLILTFVIRRSYKKEAREEMNFWDKEHDANFTRKKNIDNLHFIEIPESIFTTINSASLSASADEEQLKMLSQSVQTICQLKDKKIVNFNGITNTDLKLQYGAPNIDALSEYDSNFSELIKALRPVCEALLLNEETDKCLELLEWAVEIGGDTSYIYNTLADLYIKNNAHAHIHYLIKKAEGINSFRKSSIIKSLNEKLDAIN